MKSVKSFEDYLQTNEEAEGQMYKTKLQDIIDNAQKILNMITDEEDLEAWIQDKITIADHNMEAIVGYYSSDKGNKTKSSQPLPGKIPGATMLKDAK